MRYDDIEVFGSINTDNQKIVARLENLSNNTNFKKIGNWFLGIGLLLSALNIAGYAYFALKNKKVEIRTIKVPIKTIVQIPVEKKIYVKNPVNKNLKNQVKILQVQLTNLQRTIAKLKNKLLPISYYYTNSKGIQYISITKNNDRFSKTTNKNGKTTYFIELK